MHKKLSMIGIILFAAAIILMVVARGSDNVGLSLLALLMPGLIVLWAKLTERVRRKENEKNPITTVEATVVGHRMETHHTRYSTSHTFYVTFQPADGSENLEFEVPEEDYQDFGTGDKGPLRYRTWEYLSFNLPDRSDVKPLAPLPKEYEPAPDEITVEEDWAGAQAKWAAFQDKVKALWQKLTTRPKAAPEAAQQPVEEEDDGVLTHELDE